MDVQQVHVLRQSTSSSGRERTAGRLAVLPAPNSPLACSCGGEGGVGEGQLQAAQGCVRQRVDALISLHRDVGTSQPNRLARRLRAQQASTHTCRLARAHHRSQP